MTEIGSAIIFVGIYYPPMPPLDATILNYLNDRGGAIIFCRILAPPPQSPDATILINHLDDSERGGGRQLQYPVRS